MLLNNETGKNGEELAVQWLEQNGYSILHQNWRYSHFEIDIIATKKEVTHFIEVKTRRGNKYGEPEQAVSKQKMMNLMRAAENYLQKNPCKRVQFNILAITLQYNATPLYYFIEDVYL